MNLINASTGSSGPTTSHRPKSFFGKRKAKAEAVRRGTATVRGLAGAMLLACVLDLSSALGLPLLNSNQLVFVNVDHAPMGACSTINYGYKGDICGIGTETGNFPYWNPSGGGGGGALIAVSGGSGMQMLPFALSVSNISTTAHFFSDTDIARRLTPCTDEYTIAPAGLRFTHYTPAWQMNDLTKATLAEKKRFFLPATWLTFTVENTNSTPKDFYYGLPVAVTQKAFLNGAYQGFALGEAAVVVQSGTCDLLSGAALTAVFNKLTQGFAFHIEVPAGQTKTLTVVIAYFRNSILDSRTGALYYYTSLYPSIDQVIDAAFQQFGDARFRCQQLAMAMAAANLNPYRQFIASHALHSYMADTACLIDPQSRVHWWEVEGIFDFINTFDLTVDHAYYDSLMHPWALRNVLDTVSGALGGGGYSFTAPLVDPAGTQVSTAGYSFYHDMGHFPTSGTGPAYGGAMGDEELQNWILSAGLYWAHTLDNRWLTNNSGVLQACLNSMLLRDNTNAPARDGVTKNVNSGEITTFDSLDGSLRTPAFSGRLAVRNWAVYLALNQLFNQIGDATDAATCESMAGIASQTMVNRWNTYRGTLGYIPALLDGSSKAAILPMVEGLVYPAAMGLTNAVDRTGGPYAAMLQALSNHVMAVLSPGKCIDSSSGAWLVTSASTITWQSKVFLAQYAAEKILGIPSALVDGTPDQVHASVQIEAASYDGFMDAFYGPGSPNGGHHYPRGITTALWWLSPTNNPAFPVASAAPSVPATLSAVGGNQTALLLWQGVAFADGYNVKRSTTPGGPYTVVTNGLSGASFTDSGLSNGTTYYYVLTATNSLGESAMTSEVSVNPLVSSPGNISATLSATSVTITWPPSYQGWILQTNATGLNNPLGWTDVPGSQYGSQSSFPLNQAVRPTEFFRLRHP